MVDVLTAEGNNGENNQQADILSKNKEIKVSKTASDSSYAGDSDDLSEWTEDDEEEDKESNPSQNIDEDFIDFSFSGKRLCGDGEEQPISTSDRLADDDEDKKNPAYVPRKGPFFEHDLRKKDSADEVETGDGEELKNNCDLGNDDKKIKWVHDRFDEKSQRPKSVHELVTLYGFNIRKQEKYIGSIVRPVFKHRCRGPGHSDRMNGRKKTSMASKKAAFRTFIVVKNKENQTVTNVKPNIADEKIPEVNKAEQDQTTDREDCDDRKNSKDKDKKPLNTTKDSIKNGILKNTNKPSEEDIKHSPKLHHKVSPVKYTNKTISFDKRTDCNPQVKKQGNDKKIGTFNKNETYIDSFYKRSQPSEETTFDDTFRYSLNNDFDFPSFSGEIFIGRPIYSIRGNFKKKKNLVGSGRIAPVIGSKASPSTYTKALEQRSGGFEPKDGSGNMVYTNSNMGEQMNRKYIPDYRNKVVIETNKSQGDNNDKNDNGDFPKENNYRNYPHNNLQKFNKTWDSDGCHRSYHSNYSHGYTGWGKYKGGRLNGGRGWMRSDNRYNSDCQDVRLIVMCGDNDSNDDSLKGENEEVSRIIGNNSNLQNDDISKNNLRNNNRKDGKRFQGEYTKEDILPPMTCSVISRGHKTTPVYSVASERNDANGLIKNGPILPMSSIQSVNPNSSDQKNLNESCNHLRKLSLTRSDVNKNNQTCKNKQSVYPRLPVLPKNRLFHPNSFNNSQAYASTAFLLPSGPMISCKNSNDKNAIFGHQLFALPVQVTPVPFMFGPPQPQHFQQPRQQQPQSRMQQTRNRNIQLQQQPNFSTYHNPHMLAQTNFAPNFMPTSQQFKHNDAKMKLPAPKNNLKAPFGNSPPVTKPNTLSLFSTITVTRPSTSLSSSSTHLSFTTTTITTPSVSSVTTLTSSSHSPSTSHSKEPVITTSFKLSPHAAAFESCHIFQSSNQHPKTRILHENSYKFSKKQNYKLNSNETVYELTSLKFQPKCPIEVRGGTVYFSPEIQPKRCFSAGKKSSNKQTFITAEISETKGLVTRPKNALAIIDPKSMKELEEARKADGCEATEGFVSDNPCSSTSTALHDGSDTNKSINTSKCEKVNCVDEGIITCDRKEANVNVGTVDGNSERETNNVTTAKEGTVVKTEIVSSNSLSSSNGVNASGDGEILGVEDKNSAEVCSKLHDEKACDDDVNTVCCESGQVDCSRSEGSNGPVEKDI